MQRFGFAEYEMDLSTRPEKSVGSDEIWKKSEAALRDALDHKGYMYSVDEGGGAFYGPKIDVKAYPSVPTLLPNGRMHLRCVTLLGGNGSVPPFNSISISPNDSTSHTTINAVKNKDPFSFTGVPVGTYRS